MTINSKAGQINLHSEDKERAGGSRWQVYDTVEIADRNAGIALLHIKTRSMTNQAILVLLVWLYGAAIYEARPDAQPSKVEVCHYDNALQKYTLMQVAVSGWQGGHSKHGKDCCVYDQVDVCPISRRCDAPGAAIVMAIDRIANTCTPTCASNPSLVNGAFSCIGTVVGKSCVGGCAFGYAGKPAATCRGVGTYSIVGSCEPAPDVDGCAPPAGNPCCGCDTSNNPGAINQTCHDDPGLGPGFTCACDIGYTLDANTKCCKDTDKCSSNSCNTAGNFACKDAVAPGTGYSCVCSEGFTLALDGTCAVPISGTIALYTDGYYCTDNPYLVCNNGGIGGLEMFSVVVVGPNKVALRGGRQGLYCSNDYVVYCNKYVLSISEQYIVEYLGGDQITLQRVGGDETADGTYCNTLKGVTAIPYVYCNFEMPQTFHVVRIS